MNLVLSSSEAISKVYNITSLATIELQTKYDVQCTKMAMIYMFETKYKDPGVTVHLIIDNKRKLKELFASPPCCYNWQKKKEDFPSAVLHILPGAKTTQHCRAIQ